MSLLPYSSVIFLFQAYHFVFGLCAVVQIKTDALALIRT